MIPANAKRIAIRPLALGEKTGHHHSLYAEPGICLGDSAEMYEVEESADVVLLIKRDGISFQHQEHKTHLLPPIDYVVRIQQEVTDWGRSPVQD